LFGYLTTVLLTPSTPFAYPQVLSRRFASFRVADSAFPQVSAVSAPGSIPGSSTRSIAFSRESDLDRLVSELGPPARGCTAELTNLEEAHELLARAGPIDVLVANAGVEIPQDLAVVSEAALEEAIRINLLAPAALARAALAPMKKRGEGHIVFMSSVAGLVATSGNGTVYTATKWGLRGLGLALRQELYGTGIGVSTIFPGPVRGAGMFARTHVALPRGAGTVSPQNVARSVARAVEQDRPEITVAAGSVRVSAMVGGVAPVLVGRLARLAGAARVREAMLNASNRGDGTEPGG
jgi:short-subunit dehydrogenase